ncbi:MAG: xanthine dehydrogenase accessory factor [Paraglaciecola sp.]|jgi:xanthine dehydrogenase accessory factor
MNYLTEFIPILLQWTTSGQRVTLARVVKTWGSSPRPMGSVMLINENGDVAGSVSGGCVEGDVIKKAHSVFETNQSEVVEYGITNEDAWSVGLACGGRLTVLIENINFTEDSFWNELVENIQTDKTSVLISSLNGPNSASQLISLDQPSSIPHDTQFTSWAKEAIDNRKSFIQESSEESFFIQLMPRRSQLIIIGATHIAVELIPMAKQLNFETILIDPRSYFIEHTTFKTKPDQLLTAYPSEVLADFTLDEFTFCAALSHDPKIDDNAFEYLLNKPLAYIGALGSKKSHVQRIQRLIELGISKELIDKIHAPIGLAIKAKGATEIALSIISQIIATKNQHQ